MLPKSCGKTSSWINKMVRWNNIDNYSDFIDITTKNNLIDRFDKLFKINKDFYFKKYSNSQI